MNAPVSLIYFMVKILNHDFAFMVKRSYSKFHSSDVFSQKIGVILVAAKKIA
jgi:hypothetical protein